MKKALYSLLIIAFFFQNGFSQEYTFDSYYEYKTLNNGSTNFYFINSKDNSYFLNGTHGSESIYGTVIDLKKNITHEYEVINHENSIQFNYLFSKKYNLDTYGSNFVVETSEKEIDSTKREIKIVIFKNKRKKKIECVVDILIENSDDLFCNQLLNAFSHGRLKNTNFKIDKGILLNFKVDFQNGFKVETKLIKKQKINTLLSISKEEIKYN